MKNKELQRFLDCATSLRRMGTLFFVIGLLFACSKEGSGNTAGAAAQKKPPVPVTVGVAVEKTVPVELRAIGNVEAYATVVFKAQVGGELVGVHFKEGGYVKKGDMLFTIDPRPFDAKAKQAEANLAKDKAQLENARKQVDRYASVVKKGYVSQEQYDQINANATALEAAVKADEAALENAKLELRNCYIRSPINGYTGNLKVDQGNIIKAVDNDKPLVTVNQTSPIHVTFSIPERNLPELKKHMAAGKLAVEAAIPGVEGQPARGELDFMDNTVDQTTGTIVLKAVFLNEDKALWPGQFVNVVLTLTTQPHAVVIPSQAVQTGQQGQYVFVVKPDLTVEYRPVVVERTVNGEAIVGKGIGPGEKVVTDGQLRLAAGSEVKMAENVEKAGEAPQK